MYRTAQPRRVLALLVLVLMALAACGNSSADGDDNATSTTEAPDADAGDGGDTSDGDTDGEGDTASSWPVEIVHRHGTTVIEAAPERVVSLGLRDVDALLALGVVPVGIQPWFGDQPDAVWPWAHDLLGGASPEVLDGTQIDFEAIARLRPDVIIAVDAGLEASDYELLAQIAPTVAPPEDSVDFAVPWRDRTLMVAEAVGKVDLAEELIAEVEAKIAKVKEANPEIDGATALIGLASSDGQAYAYGSDDVRSQLLVELGMEIPEHIESQVPDGSFYVTLSAENLDQMDADVVIWIGAQASLEAIADRVVFSSRVRDEGRDLFVPYDPYGGAISYASVLSLPFLVEDFVPELVLALDGDPSTVSSLATP